MQSTIWRRCAVGVFVLASAALGTAQQTANDPSPLVLPGHRYDLPATLITAAQIEAHKKNMIAASTVTSRYIEARFPGTVTAPPAR
jgi:hypothetical protein